MDALRLTAEGAQGWRVLTLKLQIEHDAREIVMAACGALEGTNRAAIDRVCRAVALDLARDRIMAQLISGPR